MSVSLGSSTEHGVVAEAQHSVISSAICDSFLVARRTTSNVLRTAMKNGVNPWLAPGSRNIQPLLWFCY